MKTVTFFGKSDVGKIRTNNEDAFLVCNIWDNDHILAVAIDGVGGYEGGEVAAALAREEIHEFLKLNSQGDSLELLKQAVIAANNRIFRERENTPSLGNMSCVLTASLVELDSMRVNLAHVGDTRLYQYSSSRLEKLSHDHSLVGYREEIGDLTEEEAMTHPQRNIISRDVGSALLSNSDSEYVEVASYPLEHKTQLLLCSDGLCDMVTSKQMSQILSQEVSVENKVDCLIQAALDAGGRDNVTVVLVYVDSDEDVPEEEPYVPEVIDTVINQSNSEYKTGHHAEAEPGRSGLQKFTPLAFLIVFIVGFVAGVICRPMIISDKETVKNISADTDSRVAADNDSIANDSTNADSLSNDLPEASAPDQPV